MGLSHKREILLLLHQLCIEMADLIDFIASEGDRKILSHPHQQLLMLQLIVGDLSLVIIGVGELLAEERVTGGDGDDR